MSKRTRQREAILRLLRGATSHPTADQLYDELKKEIPNVGLATVYRNLKLLHEEGEIAEMVNIHGATHFDGNASEHYHFRCDKCGIILDVPEPVDRHIEARVARKTGLSVTHHHLELGGLCSRCQSHETQV